MSAPRVLQFNSKMTGGGTDDHCVKLTYGLQQQGVDACLLGPDDREYSRKARDLNLDLEPAREGFLMLPLILHAARMIRRRGIQVIHGHHGRDLWPTVLAARLSGRRPKIVLTRHLAKSPRSWLGRHFLLRFTDAMIAVSHFVAKVLREGVYEPDSPEAERRARPPMRGDFSRIHVIPVGIDTGRFRPMDALAQRAEWGLRPEHRVFAVIGGYYLPRGKGQREFLSAAARIHDRVPEARFLLIGRGTLGPQLERDIADLQLGGKAWLTPYAHDMPAVMNAIDCLVHPQVGTEALGLVVLEALACGKPVIASALDGIPEAFAAGGYGRLVAPENIDELAEAMLEWSRRPALNPAEKAALHARVDRDFSLSVSTRRVKELYEQLLMAKTAP